MVKKGTLNNIEKYYIEGNRDLSVKDLANALDRSTNIVKKYLEKTPPVITKKQKGDEPRGDEPKMFQLMGRHERNGEKVATVMTPAASELADAHRSKLILNKKMQESIHKPIKK